MDTQTDLEGLEQQAQKDNSQIDSFLENLENKDSIINVLNTENFYDEFENLLNNTTPIEKIKLKKQLKECKEDDENIKLVLIEHIYKNNGYNTADKDVLKAISDNNISTENIEQQANSDKEAINNGKRLTINNEQQAVNDEQQAVNNEQLTIETVSGQKELNDAISARQELVNKIPELNRQTNEDSELYQATKSEFEQNGIIQQLKDSNHDETFINNYILVHTTLKELKQNENYKDVNFSFFEKAVKNLDNACNIPDTKFDNFSTKNITHTRSELFNNEIGNNSLIKAKESNKSSPQHKKFYNEIFALNENEDTDTQLIERYGKFVEDDELKNLINRYQNKDLSEQEGYTLRKGLESTKENIDNQTKDLIEEMCLIAPIQGIFACIGPELGNNFELNKSREISNEDGEITITGHIDGIKFSLHQDTTDPDARLQTSSTLTKIDNNKFEIGEKFENSPYKLPTNGDIFTIATSCITDGDVTSAKNASEYFQLLQENISDKFDTVLYKKAKYANNYIKDKIKGEKVSNQYLDILGQIKGSPLSGNIEQSNSKLYNFIDLINSTNYISTTSEKGNINKCLETIQDIISTHGKTDKQSSKYPKLIRHFLMKKKMLRRTKKILNGHDISGESIFDLFGYYTEQNSGIKTINFRQLQKDLEGKEGQESLVASMRQDKLAAERADNELNKAMKDMDLDNAA